MQVLVVDDDPLMVDIASRALRVGGYQVDGVLSGEAAIRAMAIQKPQLVVLDARMPIMSGFDLLKLMKSDRQLADIPVIMLTGLRAKADVLKAGELGAAAYIVKPFDTDLLLRRVQRCLAGPKTRGAGVAGDTPPGADSDETWML